MTDRHKILKIMVAAGEEEDPGDIILMMDTAIRRLSEHGYEITRRDNYPIDHAVQL